MPAIIKRRLWWKGQTAEMVRREAYRDRFHWYRRTRDVTKWVDDKPVRYEEDTWYLCWEGAGFEYFTTEVELKLYLIRLAYDIQEYHLVPSILLLDAGLWYSTGDWVDQFGCTDKNNEIEEFSGDFPGKIPQHRILYLAGAAFPGVAPRPPVPPSKEKVPETARDIVRSVVVGFLAGGKKKKPFSWTNILPPLEPPDEECVFVLPLKKCRHRLLRG